MLLHSMHTKIPYAHPIYKRTDLQFCVCGAIIATEKGLNASVEEVKQTTKKKSSLNRKMINSQHTCIGMCGVYAAVCAFHHAYRKLFNAMVHENETTQMLKSEIIMGTTTPDKR